MKASRTTGILLAMVSCCLAVPRPVTAQCCLNDLFAGCCSCFRKAPAYAAVPVVPVAAPVVAPVIPMPAPPQPVMVPMQQTSYVPETTYRTEYKQVAVTSYKPSCEIDPCTGCPVQCMQPVTEYVQQAVNVPVTQYRAVTTTRYVQMQPGYAPQAGVALPASAAPPAASPFSGVQTTPQAWGAAGADVSRQPLPGVAPPALPPGSMPPGPTYQYQSSAQAIPQAAPQMTVPQTITPQSGTYAPSPQPPLGQPQPQPTQPPALSPAPSLRPIPELPRTGAGNGQAAAGGTAAGSMRSNGEPARGSDSDARLNGSVPATSGPQAAGPDGMPVLPGEGPNSSTGAFPRLLEPTSHTTSWVPSDAVLTQVQYPTAALPAWRHGQR